MLNMPGSRLMAPKAASGEILRSNLIDRIISSASKLAYIQGGAGYGKTTLLSQISNNIRKSVWLSLDGEEDVFTFINTLCEAIRHTFPDFDFPVSEYLPFTEKKNFISMLAGALICNIESIAYDFILILDDLHTITDHKVKKLITYLVKYFPDNARLCFGSREAPSKDFLSFKARGSMVELTQKDLAFTREEISEILGFDDPAIYGSTEGWPLAIRSFRVLLENGITISDITYYSKETLYAYLFHECISNLNFDMVDFLKKSACFEELEPEMLDEVLNKKNTKLMLESLVSRNIFTIKTADGSYRYHSLFKKSLLETEDKEEMPFLRQKAAAYFFNHKHYSKAARYAFLSKDNSLLQKIILECYKDYIKKGSYNELRIWFQALDDATIKFNPEILVAKGVFLSILGNFVQSNACLEAAIPLINKEDKELYFQAMIHKARVLRNFVTFDESNKLLNALVTKLDDFSGELIYSVVIEKLYNLCWDSKIGEAYTLAQYMIKTCANVGNVKVMHWFERYLCTIQFFRGNMRESVYYYEKSLELPESERSFLGMHSTAIYVAKAYQMLGKRSLSLSILSEELQRLRNTGNYEEMWAGYLLAAEIHYQNAFIDKMNGENASYETTIKYFNLADEYAPLYRKTDFQMNWAKMQRLTYSLIFTDASKEELISEIVKNLDNAGAYLTNLVTARLMGYFSATSDYPNAVKYASLCIETGEKNGIMLHASLAYGVLARATIESKDYEKAFYLTRHYFKLCFDNGLYEYFKIRKAYGPVIQFAYDNGIEPEITKQFMEFAGYKQKKAYIETLGVFTVYEDRNKQKLLKFRTKKERELLAFLLDADKQGATKEQIYNAIWWDSDSKNVKNLIAVNLRHLKNDLDCIGLGESVVHRENRYFIYGDEFECDCDLYEKIYEEFKLHCTKGKAQQLIALYKGEYLSDFEAHWASAKRIKYQEIYEDVKKLL